MRMAERKMQAPSSLARRDSNLHFTVHIKFSSFQGKRVGAQGLKRSSRRYQLCILLLKFYVP